jgi:glycolate oxidase FAD binding subunit
MGALGVITEVTLKLWPVAPARGWFTIDDNLTARVALAKRVLAEVHRPAAVLLSPGTLSVQLMGYADDITAPDGMQPAAEPATPRGLGTVRVGVAPTALWALAEQLEALGVDYEAQAGVGLAEVIVPDVGTLAQVREAAVGLGGHAVVVDAPASFRADPWGAPPSGAQLMHKLKAVFDPAGILSPGRLVGSA